MVSDKVEETISQGIVIGKGIHIKGILTGAEEVSVEGSIEGTINLKSKLFILKGGVVNGDIQAEYIKVEGEMKGNMKANDAIEISETARVVADIKTPSLSIAEGAKFRGDVDMEVEIPREFQK